MKEFLNPIIFMIVFLLLSCASQSPKQNENKTPAVQTSSPTSYCKGYQAPSPSPSGASLGTNMALLETLDGNALNAVSRSKQNFTFCDALTSAQKKVALFQFAGVKCSTCPGETQQIESGINSNPNNQNFVHFLVFSDDAKDFSEQGVDEFLAKVGNSNVKVLYDVGYHESFIKVSNFATQSSVQPTFGTTLALNLLNQVAAISKGEHINEVLTRANELLNNVK